MIAVMLPGPESQPNSPQLRLSGTGLSEPDTMQSTPSQPIPSESSSTATPFSDIRSVRWRINLGVLPHADSSIEEFRRVTADSRRRYAVLRRHLLVDPQFLKDDNKPLDLVMDNPLSQNPDSMWGRFFRNAELERSVDLDLSRLYPEQESYFQTVACQAMLRRILLLWTLKHPEYGYRQGMHELLAPLLYVLHVDVQRLSQVRELYQDVFNDKFDNTSFTDNKLIFSKASSLDSPKQAITKECDKNFRECGVSSCCNLEELEPDVKTIVLLNDAYGAEGELGILLSERFMEHDAYCMFDAQMSGAHGMVALADFFSPSPAVGSLAGLPPIIEASSALYHLLSIVDTFLHSHLVELGVEPQYFSLRWLRVLFGREFLLENLLVLWDEIFASPNDRLVLSSKGSLISHYKIFTSARGVLIIALAVSMLLHLRSSLLATEHATTCLQRLLNFPENTDLKKLIEKAKSLQVLALDTSICLPPLSGALGRSKSAHVRNYSLPSDSLSPRTPLSLLADSYWEEKWRVLHKADEHQSGKDDPLSSGLKGSSHRGNPNLSRTESTSLSRKSTNAKMNAKSSVRRSLLEDFSQVIGEVNGDCNNLRSSEIAGNKNFLSVDVGNELCDDLSKENIYAEDVGYSERVPCEDSPIFSFSTTPSSQAPDHENDSEKSSVTSNSCVGDNEDEVGIREELPCSTLPDNLPFIESKTLEKSEPDKAEKKIKERKPLSGKLHWLLRFGRVNAEGTCEKGGRTDVQKNQSSISYSSCVNNVSNSGGVNIATDTSDKNVMGTLRNLGQSMLENIQVIESVFQQDRGQVVGSLENLPRNLLNGKGQVTAMAALKELRKVSNILSEM